MCPNNTSQFVDQNREILGLEFDNVPRAPRLMHSVTESAVELVYHGSRRVSPLKATAVALRLADVVSFRNKRAKFESRSALCAAFKIDPSSTVILTGVDHDARIEPWWALGSDRIEILHSLKELGVHLASTPNFSVLLDNPRTDDLHSMKRIAIVFSEFQQAGIACALHTNGRTPTDFLRWGEFISERPEVQVIAYEFITGPRQKLRQQFHLEQLVYLASVANRPLDLLVRGDPNVIPFLLPHFRKLIYIDTTAFVKTQKRHMARRLTNHSLDWSGIRTAPGVMLDNLLQHNIDEQLGYLRSMYFAADLPVAAAA